MIIGIALTFFCIVVICLCRGQQGVSGQRKKESQLPGRMLEEYAESGKIRVLLKNNGYKQIVHESVQLQAQSGLCFTYGGLTYESKPGESVTVNPDDERFRTGSIRVKCINEMEKFTVLSLKRGYGTPSYRGMLELFSTAEGIVMVNELPLEAYLYAVVPSEMPASYELEALKAQAVCARSYAYNQCREFSYPEYGAHVDDSTSFQVYGNSMEKESARRAVDETCGEKIWYRDKVATAYYYSTSCGKSASITAWGGEMTEDKAYLKSVSLCDEAGVDYEKELAWYRWSVEMPADTLCNQIELYTKKELGTLQSVTVTKQGDGGIAQEVKAVGSKGTAVVKTENKIRRALGGTGCVIRKNDGSEATCGELLPSAFITVNKKGSNYIIEGGGYGHGIGMSQNGANEMAKRGKDYKEILTTFYTGVLIEK